MKKYLIIGSAIILALIALAAGGLVYAQTQTPPSQTELPFPGYGPGMMGRGGMMGGWRGQTSPDGYGPMHQYMLDAFAEALDLTPEEVQARLDAGESMWQIAEAEGISAEALRDFMIGVRTQALSAAVADGVLTQEQADWMIQRMEQMPMFGFGAGRGGCPGLGGEGGPGGGMMRGWRWNSQP
jgi:hypothetical protein